MTAHPGSGRTVARDETVSTDVVAWLRGPDAERWFARFGANQGDLLRSATAAPKASDALGMVTAMRAEGVDAPNSAALASVVAARRRMAQDGHPLADRLLVTLGALEQASPPACGIRRARRFAAAADGTDSLADLGCGAGLDLQGMAAVWSESAQLHGVDLDGGRVAMARHNLAVLGVGADVVEGDARDVGARRGAPWWHADPGRRAGGRRLRGLANLLPPVDQLVAAHGEARGAAIVSSPAIDLHDPALPAAASLEFCELDGSLVESVVLVGELAREGAVAAIARPRDTARPLDGEDEPIGALLRWAEREWDVLDGASVPTGADVPPPLDDGFDGVNEGDWLVECRPAVVRARLHDAHAASVGGRRIVTARAMHVAAAEPEHTPFLRSRRIEAVLPARPKAVRRWLRGRDDHPITVTFHGLDGAVGTWMSGLGRPRTGPSGRRIAVVRTDVGAVALALAPAAS